MGEKELEIKVAEHKERIEDLEERVQERREANKEIFTLLKEINEKITKLQINQAVNTVKIIGLGIGGGAIPAIVTLILLLLTGKI